MSEVNFFGILELACQAVARCLLKNEKRMEKHRREKLGPHLHKYRFIENGQLMTNHVVPNEVVNTVCF